MKTCFHTILFAFVLPISTWSAQAIELGSRIGPLKLTALSGDQILMDNYAERPLTAVIFVSARCEPTDKATSGLNELHQRHRLRNALFVGVCSNPDESGDELREFAQRRGIVFPVYRDPDAEIARHLAARTTPEVFVLDGQGILVFRGGAADVQALQDLEAAIVHLLAKKPVAKPSSLANGTPIGRPGVRHQIDDPYGTVSFSSELVFEKIASAAAHHCSTICEAANGDLLCLWYGGSYESADDQALFLARKRPADKLWSQPNALMQNALRPPGNGVVFRDRSDRVWIVWCRMEGSRPMRRGSGWGKCRLMARTSTDHGVTWSEDRPLLDENVWCVPRNPPITLTSGSMLLGVEGSMDDQEGSHFLTLAPTTSSWKRAGFTRGGSQPTVIQRADGSLLALLRHSRNIMEVESRDDAQQWSVAQATPLKNPDSGISMTKLANGHLVLVFNDSQTGRTPLSIARSLDEGRSWEQPLHLESNPGEYSYPCVIQSNDGHIHITYTFRRYSIKHLDLNEDWLVHVRRPN